MHVARQQGNKGVFALSLQLLHNTAPTAAPGFSANRRVVSCRLPPANNRLILVEVGMDEGFAGLRRCDAARSM